MSDVCNQLEIFQEITDRMKLAEHESDFSESLTALQQVKDQNDFDRLKGRI